jgi:hypothetical protein
LPAEQLAVADLSLEGDQRDGPTQDHALAQIA